MNPNPHKIRCFVCDLRKVWSNLRHEKVARWTLIVHVVYYVHGAIDGHGLHVITAALCAGFLMLELLARD